jgi:toxin ParE1/3/4
MTGPIRFDHEASDELEAAVLWYERQRPGLGEEFLQSVDEAIHRIQAFPEIGGLHPHIPYEFGVRRLLVRRFPYTVVYLELRDEIRVLAIAHLKRRPGYWTERAAR